VKPQGSEAIAPQGDAFESALQRADLKLSKHAVRRLDSRQIHLSEADQTRLGQAVSSLEKKGARDSLVLMGQHAFIVNVPSKTVVTALSKAQMNEHVFTNIDSTILLDQ